MMAKRWALAALLCAAVCCATVSGAALADAADNCVEETPVVTYVDVYTDQIDVRDGPLMLDIYVGSRSEPSAILARFSANVAGITFDVTDFARDRGRYHLTKMITSVETAATYRITYLRFTDLAGAVTEVTDFSGLGPSDYFVVTRSNSPVAPSLKSLKLKEQNIVDLRNGQESPLTFQFRVQLAIGVSFGRIAFQYTCPTAGVPALEFANTTAVPTATAGEWTGEASMLVAPGTRDCTYAVSTIYLSDTSLASTKVPTALNPTTLGTSVVAPSTIQVATGNKGDTVAPTLVGSAGSAPVWIEVVNSTVANTTLPAAESAGVVVNSTFESRVVNVCFRVNDTGIKAAGAYASGVGSITFTGQFSTGLVINAVLTRAVHMDAATGVWKYPIVLPRAFPPATFSIAEESITVTDRAKNSLTGQSSSAGFSVVCGGPIRVHDTRDDGEASLNGFVALVLILMCLTLGLCFFLVRRQRLQKMYEFDPNADIPAVPGTGGGLDATADDTAREISQSQSSRQHHAAPMASATEQLHHSARDAVAEMAAARAEMEAARARDEAAREAAAAAAREAAAANAAAAAAAANTTGDAQADPGAANTSVAIDVAPVTAAAGVGASPVKPADALGEAGAGVAPGDELAISMGAPASPTTAAAQNAVNESQPDLL